MAEPEPTVAAGTADRHDDMADVRLTEAAAAGRIAIETERLLLRELGAGDAAFILDLLNQPSFLQHIGDRGVRTLGDARAYIADGPIASYREHGFGLFLVEVRESGASAGMCGLMRKPWLDAPDLAYAFLPQHWSRGYAREAAAAVLAQARVPWGIGRVTAVVTSGNAPSLRLLARLGFRFERTITDPTGTTLRLLSAGA
jgi:[ribosomal protein S5]-alanine N-acetyltransferase